MEINKAELDRHITGNYGEDQFRNRTMVSTAREFEEALLAILEDQNTLEDEDGPEVSSVGTFENEGILTRNRGLVVRLRNGAEFQITIVQSQEAEGSEEDQEEGTE
jgi:hypothetical protein